MSEPAQEQGKTARSMETKRRWVKVSLVILFLLSAANIFLMLVIVPKFEQIFADALPGMPLPRVTNLIITGRIVIAMVTVCWPILGTILVRQQKPYAILWINVGIIAMLLQCGTTIIALYMPMVRMGDIYSAPSL